MQGKVKKWIKTYQKDSFEIKKQKGQSEMHFSIFKDQKCSSTFDITEENSNS